MGAAACTVMHGETRLSFVGCSLLEQSDIRGRPLSEGPKAVTVSGNGSPFIFGHVRALYSHGVSGLSVPTVGTRSCLWSVLLR